MRMNSPRSEDVWQQVVAFVFAAADMKQAAAAAKALKGEQEGYLRHALETAIGTCYARPYGDNRGVGKIDKSKWAPVDDQQRGSHKFLLHWRKKLYAHSDYTPLIRDAFHRGGNEFSAPWVGIDQDMLEPIQVMCEAQARRFREKASELHESLSASESKS